MLLSTHRGEVIPEHTAHCARVCNTSSGRTIVQVSCTETVVQLGIHIIYHRLGYFRQ